MKSNNPQGNSILGKRKKVTEKRGDYLHKWIEAQAGYRPGHGHNPAEQEGLAMFSGLNLPPMMSPLYPVPPSEPPFYRYPLPFQPPFNGIPPYASHPLYPELSADEKDYLKNRKIKSAKHRSSSKISNIKSEEAGRTEDEFTSLPVIGKHIQQVQNIVPEEEIDRRRYSDPGLAQESNSQSESSDSEDFKTERREDKSIIMCLIQQIKTLNENNTRLHRELYETKGELELLKQQMAAWNSDVASRHSSQMGHNMIGAVPNGIHSGSSAIYSPGMLSDLVREIRDAARVREDAMYNKMKSMFEEKANKINGNAHYEKNMTDWKSIDHYKIHSKDKSNTNDRLAKLEDELQMLRINQSRDEFLPTSSPGMSMTNTVNHSPSAEQERRRLRMELNEEKLARSKAENNVHKLEMLVTQLRSMMTNGGGVSSASTPADPLNMVLGPVTDL